MNESEALRSGATATAATEPAAGTAPSRGRLDKRRAILEAALKIFSRDGYAQASLDMIATEAGVAKPTIYNHLGGKENLFRAVMTETAARANDKTLSVLDGFPADSGEPDRLRGQLAEVAHRLAACYCDEQSAAVRRLLHAEALRFPDLFGSVRAGGPDYFIEALAGRLARLANAGLLEVADPVRAARQFIALISDELPMAAAVGAEPGPDEIDEVVAAGVDTFLRAFGVPAVRA
jgi:AcrR family transcriptional regulator